MRYHTVMLPQRQNTAWVPGFVSTTVLSLLLSIQHSYWEHMVCQSLWGSMNRFFHYHQLALRDNIWVELISIGRNLQLNGSSRNYRKTSRCETGRSRSRGLSCCPVQFIQEGLGSAAEDNGDSFTVNRALVLRRSMDSHVQRKVLYEQSTRGSQKDTIDWVGICENRHKVIWSSVWLVGDTSIAPLIDFIYMDRAGMKQIVISWLPIKKVSYIL